MDKTEMTSLSQVMNSLKKKGYTEDFNLKPDGLDYDKGKLHLAPDDFVIDQVYRFEGESDPGDEAILYAISSEKHLLKGILVNGYGIYANTLTDVMAKKLNSNYLPG